MSKNLVANFQSILSLKRSLSFLFILHFCFLVYSQDSIHPKKMVHGIETNVSITRFDIFHSFAYRAKMKRFQCSGGFGYGINRSVFQQRFFPKVSIQGSYSILEKPKFVLGPSIYYSFSWLKINANTNHFSNWNEFFGGIQWQYGKKWKIGQTISAGYFSESYFNKLKQQRSKVGNWGYCMTLSLIHEL